MGLEFLQDREVEAKVWDEGRTDLVLIKWMSPVPILVIVQILVYIGSITALLETSLGVLDFPLITQIGFDVVTVKIRCTLTSCSTC